MASYGKGGGFNTYKEVQTYQDEWGKPITTVSNYPDPVSHPVISDCSTAHGVVVRAQRIVEVRRSYDIPLKGLLDEHNVHEDHSPRKVHEFFNKIHNEASRPTHPTLLSPPKWITNKPSWRSEDHDSPKYSKHHDFSDNDWEKSSGSPLRDKFEGLHLQDNCGSSPYKYKKDGYEKPSFTSSIGSPKAGHFKDYGVNNTWDSPPRSTSTHDDYAYNKGISPHNYNKDDHVNSKFNGGYKTTSPTLSQATNDIGTAMKILEEGNIPMASPTYAPQSHFPASFSVPHIKESYPERTVSHVSTQPSHYPTWKENYPEPTRGMKPLFSPASKQQPYPPTSHSTPEMKQSYPDHAVQGWKPSFSPSSPQKERYSLQMEDHYPDKIQGRKPFQSPYENTQELRFGAIVPSKEAIDSSEARKRYANLKPVSPEQMKYSGTIDSREAVKKYNGAFVP